MCGIAGLIDRKGRWSREELANIARRMADAMPYRGPDDSGVWVSPDGSCAMSHRRLSIIDTSSGGHQPFVLDGGDRERAQVITFNGEIYNYLELKHELEAHGHTFRTKSDTEVLLQLLAEQGHAALEQIDGQFAFGYWQQQSRELLLGRDPFGEKPLYWTKGDGWFAFASELHVLTKVPGFDDRIDADTIAEYLALQYIDAPRTIYRSAHKLRPGHWLRVGADGEPHIGRHFAWKPRGPVRSQRPLGDLADELEEIMLRLVRRRMIADVPLGAFLSGGVDSSTVVALMTKALGGRVKTFSIGFQNSPDETEHLFAREVAEHLGTEHHERVLEVDVLPLLHTIGEALDEPNGDSSCLPTWLVSKVAKEHVTVCLSGDGGDEMFGGYGRYFQTLKEQEAGAAGFDAGRQYYSSRMLVYCDEHLQELFGEMPPRTAALLGSLRRRLNREPGPLLHKMRQHDAEHYMPGAVLPKVDRMSMQHSLEVRTPFLSRELGAFCEQLAVADCYSTSKLGGPQGKLVLKELAQRYLPRAWLDRRKMGFGVPTKTGWGKDKMVAWLREMTLGSDSKIGNWIERKGRERFVERMASPHGFSFYQAWLMLVMETWLRSHPCSRGDDATTPPLAAQPLREVMSGDVRQEDVLLWQHLRRASAPAVVFGGDELPGWVRALPAGSVVVTPTPIETPARVENRVLLWNSARPLDAAQVMSLPTGPAVFTLPLHEANSDLIGVLAAREQSILHRVGDRWHVRSAADVNQIGAVAGAAAPLLKERLFGHKLPSRTGEIEAGDGHAFRIKLPKLANERALDQTARLVLFEDGRPLPHGDSSPQSVTLFGRGRYCLVGDVLWFAASDNSDPTRNGRRYLAALRSERRGGFVHFLGGTPLGRIAIDVQESLHRWLRRTRDDGVRVHRFRRPFANDGGDCWITPLSRMRVPTELLAQGWVPVVYEDGRELPMPDCVHEDVRRLGQGRHSVWDGHVWFSASDSSNPNRNGRTYTLALLPPGQRRASDTQGTPLQADIASHEAFDRGLSALAAEPPSREPNLGPGGRVVMVIGALYPGGTERQLCNLALQLDRRGMSVTILALAGLDGNAGHYRSLLRGSGVTVRAANVPQNDFALGAAACDERRLQLLAAMPDTIRNEVWRVFSHVASLQPDVLHCCLDSPNISGGIAGVLADVPCVALGVRSFNPTHYPKQNRAWFQPYYRLLATSPRVRLFANSRVCADDYSQWLGGGVTFRIVYNGLDTGPLAAPQADTLTKFRQELGIPAQAPLVAGLLRLSAEKCPDVFVDAIAAAKASMPELHAVLAGVGSMQSEIEKCIHKRGLQHCLHLLGRRLDVGTVLSAADVVMLTSRIEGTPNALIEAGWFGKPSVATAAGGCVEVVDDGETGILCPVGDATALGQALVTLLRDPARRRQMGDAAHRRIGRLFSLPTMVDSTLAMYRGTSVEGAVLH